MIHQTFVPQLNGYSPFWEFLNRFDEADGTLVLSDYVIDLGASHEDVFTTYALEALRLDLAENGVEAEKVEYRSDGAALIVKDVALTFICGDVLLRPSVKVKETQRAAMAGVVEMPEGEALA